MEHRERLLVVIGPSGSGKSSVVRRLADHGVVRVHPTWTTRPRRPDEVDGSLEHRFVADDEFEELDRRGFFVDTVAMFGLPYRYGLPPVDVRSAGPVDTVMLRAPLIAGFAAVYPAFRVFQIEDSPERTAERLRRRGTASVDMTARLADNERELVAGRAVADEVFVNDGSIDDLAATIARRIGAVEVAA